jgi:hypothetical protein
MELAQGHHPRTIQNTKTMIEHDTIFVDETGIMHHNHVTSTAVGGLPVSVEREKDAMPIPPVMHSSQGRAILLPKTLIAMKAKLKWH